MAQNEKVDVCIVGSGAAGGSLSLALAEAGIKVVVLEVGPWWNPLNLSPIPYPSFLEIAAPYWRSPHPIPLYPPIGVFLFS